MKWFWDDEDKRFEKWYEECNRIHEYEFDFICNLRVGNLCFDLVEREVEKGELELFADLYVGDENTGYGYAENGYPYDYNDYGPYWWLNEVNGKLKIEKDKGKYCETLEEVKAYIETECERVIYEFDKEDFRYSLIEKANEELKIW